MGWFDFLRSAKGPLSLRRSLAPKEDLFDEEFQRKLEYLAVVSRRVFSGAMRAERRTRKTGSGVEFADHRDYVAGDDFRYVDWHAFQRFDRLLVRLYEEEEDLSIYFIMDCSASMGLMNGVKFRQAKKLCAALAYVGLANLDRVAIASVNDALVNTMQPTRGKQRIFKIFRFLNLLQARGQTNLEEATRSFVARQKRRGLAVIVSDLFDPAGFEKGINVLRFHRFDPLVLHIVDPRDKHPNFRGDIRIYDCESGADREVTVTANVLRKYEDAYERYLDQVRIFCAKKQVGYFRADVDAPFEELVLRVFRQGGFLR